MYDSAIKHPEYMSQIMDYSNLRMGKKCPTDLDAFMEIRDKHFIFVECKYGTATLQGGQLYAFEHLTDALQDAGKNSVFILVSHSTHKGNVDLAQCRVVSRRYKRQWKQPIRPCVLKDYLPYVIRQLETSTDARI